MKDILNSIKKDFPEDSIYISEILQQLENEVSFVMDKYNKRLDQNVSNAKYNNILEELAVIESKIKNTIDELDINYGQMTLGDLVDADISPEEKLNPNYKDYRVDNTIVHSLEGNLTHVRPYGFKFITDDIMEAKTWKDVFIKTSEMLLKIDEKIFLSFEDKSRMNGEMRDYFSKDDLNMILPVKIMDKIYITTGMSANGYRDLIVKMLKEYDYNVEDYKLYYSADYSLLHR